MATTITLTPGLDENNTPFVDVLVTAFDAGVASTTIWRTVAGRAFVVRGLFQVPTSGVVTIRDYEAGRGVVSSYQAQQFDSLANFVSYSATFTTTLPIADGDGTAVAYVHHPLDPATSVRVLMMNTAALAKQRPSAIEKFAVPGRSVPLALHGTRAGLTGIVLDCYTAVDADSDAFDTLFGAYDSDASPILCWRVHPDLRLPSTLFVAVAAPEEDPFTDDDAGGSIWRLTGDEVAPPTAAFVLAQLEYEDFTEFYPDYAAFTAAYVDYTTATRDYSIEGTA